MTLPMLFKLWPPISSGRPQSFRLQERVIRGPLFSKFYLVSIAAVFSVDVVKLTSSSFAVLWTALIQLLLWRDRRIDTNRRVSEIAESEIESSIGLPVPADADKKRISFDAVAIGPAAGPISQ